jgi:replicative DNA helicase
MAFTGAEGFRSASNAFIEVYEKKYTRQVLNVMSAILNSPDPFVDYRGGRRREYQGYKGAAEFYSVEHLRIDALRGAQRTRQFVVGTQWLDEQLDPVYKAEREKRMEMLCKLNIPEIDSVWSGLRRTHFIGIIGPPKGGKTTLAAFMVHRLRTEGRRVAVWAMEGSAQESWIDKLIAARCYEKGLNITTKDLQDGLTGLSPEDRWRVEAARAELTQDEGLSFIEETGYVEDFLEVIDSHYRAFNRFDALVIDSLLNLQTRTGRKKSEYLSSAYILLKDYAEHKLEIPPVVIGTAQFKQEAIKEARNSAEVTFDETSGGESAETIRTPDEVLGIFGTPAQKAVNRTSIHHIATRHTSLFRTFEVRALFGCAQFSSIGN